MPRRAAFAFLGAVGGIALLILVWYASFHVGTIERADQKVFLGFGDLGRPRVNLLATRIANLCNPNPWVYFAAVPVLIALARRRWRAALAICSIELGANVTTQLLKPLLASPRTGPVFHGQVKVAAASWPSGHATASMSLVLCLVLASSPRLRPYIAALGAAFVVGVVYSFLTLGWHFPSDVLGGFLVAATWTLVAVGCVWASSDRRWAAARAIAADASSLAAGRRLSVREALGPAAFVLLGGLVLVALVAIARPHQVVAYAAAHRAFMVGAGAIAAAAVTIATGVMLAVRR
jgi:membrane-associated phospholipid phosphatase